MYINTHEIGGVFFFKPVEISLKCYLNVT